MENSHHLSWQGSQVCRNKRAKITGTTGKVIWLTGLSGSGKSTLAINVEKNLIEKGLLAFCLDGDDIRQKMNTSLGFTVEDRAEHIRRVAVIAGLFKEAGLVVLVSVISPLASMRACAKEMIGAEDFCEVYVKACVSTCKQRDPKGLYQKESVGEIKMLTGITSKYEPPDSPALVLDTEMYNINECTAQLLSFIEGVSK